MEGHAKKCVERYFEFANKTTEQLYNVATPWMDDQFKEEMDQLENCQFVHRFCTWLILGDLIFCGL